MLGEFTSDKLLYNDEVVNLFGCDEKILNTGDIIIVDIDILNNFVQMFKNDIFYGKTKVPGVDTDIIRIVYSFCRNQQVTLISTTHKLEKQNSRIK